MRLVVVAFGHRLPGWMADGVADYARRFPRDCPLEIIELKPEPRDRGRTVAQMLAAEAARVTAACQPFGRMFRIVLDERGQPWTTTALATRLAGWREAGRDVVFVLGSADGVDPALKAQADALWSLSALTLPHGVARIVVVEQLYRALSLNAGHPYHRE